MPLQRTYVAKPKDIDKSWVLVDAEDIVLGRLASLLAMRLRGKHKPTYTPNMDCGDHVIVIKRSFKKTTYIYEGGCFLLFLKELIMQTHRFENWKLRRALALPYFLRSTTRGSRVRKPPAFKTGRSPGSK